MSCDTWESMIALEVGGDLPTADAEQLAEHLGTCAHCRRFAEGMRQSQQAVALLADAPVDEEILTTVRARVLHEIGSRSAVLPFRLRPRMLALAAALAVALGALLLLRSSGPAQPIEEVEAPSPRPRVAETPATPPAATPRPISGPRPIAAEPPSAAPPSGGTPAAALAVATVALATEPPVTDQPTTNPKATEPMIIKLVSEEADLVIYWLVTPPDTATKETNDEISAV